MQISQLKKMLIMMLIALIAGAFSTSNVLAYFQGSYANNGSTISNGIINVGQWSSSNNVPLGITLFDPHTYYSNGDLVWYEGYVYIYKGYTYQTTDEPTNENNWTILNDLVWYPTVTYYTGEVVAYNGILYEAQWQHTGYEPGTDINGPWKSLIPDEISWSSGQATTLNEVVYYNNQLYIYKENYTTSEPGSTNEWGIPADLTYSQYFVYKGGEIVLYQGNYYYANWYNKGNLPTNGGAWSPYSLISWDPSTVYKGMKYVFHNGLIYEALDNKKVSYLQNEPGTAAGQSYWKVYNTTTWQPYNNYEDGDFVIHNGEYWYLANSVNADLEPGTAPDSWNDVGTLEYSPFTTYVLGQYVIYNDEVYKVVNANNANQHAPGTYADAWNYVVGYDWHWFNTYYNGDIVYYNGTVYTANEATNAEPGSNNDWSIV